MALVVTDNKHYQNIAHKIREKTGSARGYSSADMAEGVNEVYQAGKASMIDESKIIEKTVSGSVISVDDVSEIPHEVGIVVQNANLINAKKINIGYEIIVSGRNDAYPSKDWYTTEKVEVSPNTEYLLSGTSSCARVEYDDMGDALAWYNSANGASYTFITGDNTHYVRFNSLIEGHSNPSLTRQTDFASVSVKVYGKNLSGKTTIHKYVYANDYKKYNAENAVILPKGTYFISASNLPILQFFDVETKKGLLVSEIASVGTTAYYANWDGYAFIPSATSSIYNSFTLNKTAIVTMCGQNGEITECQIEVGTFQTTYEAPIEPQEFTPNADGTVEGITSISPNMTVFTDNADVYITMDYHRSYGMWLEWNRRWDGLQNYGNLTDYRFFYAAMNMNNIKDEPKYKVIKPTSLYMFSYLSTRYTSEGIDFAALCEQWGVTFDTSNCTEWGYAFSNSAIARVPPLDARGKDWATQVFYFNSRLHTVDEILVDENTKLSSTYTFNGTSNLENIKFTGTIAMSVSFAHSTKLSKASFINIFGHFSTTATFTATFSRTAVINAFGSVDSAEWTTLVASRPNVTVSLV